VSHGTDKSAVDDVKYRGQRPRGMETFKGYKIFNTAESSVAKNFAKH